MSKFLLFARDPGAANAIVPLIAPLNSRGHQVVLFGKDAALSMYHRYHLAAENLTLHINEITIEAFAQLLAAIKPDAVITGTGSDDFSEKYLWKAAQNMGIPTFAILDQWINYGIRFSSYPLIELEKYEANPDHSFVPDFVLVMDQEVRDQLVAAGIDAQRVVVTGQPYFDMVLERKNAIETQLNQENCAGEAKQLLWVSENITEPEKGQDLRQYYWGYTERSVFIHLLEQLKTLTNHYPIKIDLIIKPHPNETIDVYTDLAASSQTAELSITINKETDPLVLVLQSDLICGMSSMLLSEAAIIGQPIISVQIGLTREDPCVLVRKGLIKSILSPQELYDQLYQALVEGKYPEAVMQVEPGAVERIINLVEGYICQS